MKHKKSVLKILSANSECFRVSTGIACNKAGKQFVGFEIDEDYYEAQEKRFKDFVSQLRMF